MLLLLLLMWMLELLLMWLLGLQTAAASRAVVAVARVRLRSLQCVRRGSEQRSWRLRLRRLPSGAEPLRLRL